MLMMMLMSMPQGMDAGTTETVTQTGEAAATQGGGSALMGLIPMILIFVVFYFILILPQKKQEKKQRSMIDALVPGDEVITIGGIYGNVVSIKDDCLVIESSADKTKIKIAKSSISRCLTVKEEPKKEEKK